MPDIPGVPAVDDVNVSQDILKANWAAFKFATASDVDRYASLLTSGFSVIADALSAIDQIFVDTKFEFGYATNRHGVEELIYMDEVGTPTRHAFGTRRSIGVGTLLKTVKRDSAKRCLALSPTPTYW